MRFPVFIAVAACKATRLALRLTGRGGTALPGRVALKLRPGLLGELAKDVEVVAVTGTNGKTTSSRMLEQMYIDAGYDFFSNRSGANLASGITAEFAANATLSGKPKKKKAIIECDEGAMRVVAGQLAPKAIVVTNLFRDQLDRYGEVTHTLESIREGVKKTPDSVLCLNADCSLTASLAQDTDNPIVFFGVNEPLTNVMSSVAEAPRCIRCGAEYSYEFHTYDHLGSFYCPKCGYRRHEPDIAVTHIVDMNESSSIADFSVYGKMAAASIALPAAYNVYNAVGALAAAVTLGLDTEKALLSLGSVHSGFGRMETFDFNGASVRMILVKNPAGMNQALSYLSHVPENAVAVLCLNDNIADGTDVSWIWDADFESVFGTRKFGRLIVWGTRAEDMLLRLVYAGADESSVTVAENVGALLDLISGSEAPVYILPNYTSMLELRDALAKRCGKRRFWE